LKKVVLGQTNFMVLQPEDFNKGWYAGRYA